MKVVLTGSQIHATIASAIVHSLGHALHTYALLGPPSPRNAVDAAASVRATTAIVVLGAGGGAADAESMEVSRAGDFERESSGRNLSVKWKVVVAVADVESWLFADREGLERGLRGRTDHTLSWNAPESIQTPAPTLKRLLAPRIYLPRVAGELASLINVTRATARSRSLQRFVDALSG